MNAIAKTRSEIQREYARRTGYAANKRYDAKVLKIMLRLNPDKDADIITLLDETRPLAPQIKELIRKK